MIIAKNKKIGKKSSDGLPESHPAFSKVNPEHLAFAVHCALGVVSNRMKSVEPEEFTVSLQKNKRLRGFKLFTNNDFNRMTLTTIQQLSEVLPGEGEEAFLGRAAVMMRLYATLKAIRTTEVTRFIEKDSAGHFSLPGFVIAACSEAPLKGETGDFDLPTLLDFMQHKEINKAGLRCELHIPDGMIDG